VLDLALAQRDLTSVSATLHDAASLSALTGNYEDAARLTGAAQRIVEETGGEPPPRLINRVEAMPTLRQKLPAARLDELLAEGRGLPTDQAAAIALTD
jgi:hypothetical protein